VNDGLDELRKKHHCAKGCTVPVTSWREAGNATTTTTDTVTTYTTYVNTDRYFEVTYVLNAKRYINGQDQMTRLFDKKLLFMKTMEENMMSIQTSMVGNSMLPSPMVADVLDTYFYIFGLITISPFDGRPMPDKKEYGKAVMTKKDPGQGPGRRVAKKPWCRETVDYIMDDQFQYGKKSIFCDGIHDGLLVVNL
jgi:hypothetical protein